MAEHKDSPKYSNFRVLEVTYKAVGSHNIDTYVLVPKSTPQNPRPVIVKFHGGWLVTGTALYPDWFPRWLIDYALQHGAVVVLPNHRLLPEANGAEIMEDLHDFWKWLREGFQDFVNKQADNIQVDLGRVLVTGESSGGYLSIQSALETSEGMAKASIATYPVLDLKSPFYSQEYEKKILGAPTVPKEVFASHLEGVAADAKAGKKRGVTSATPPARLPFSLSIIQQGLYPKVLGEEKVLYPLERVEDVHADDVPPILIIHGRDDSGVPVEGSEKWVEVANNKFGEGKVVLVTQPGEHGFDNDPSITLETAWLKNELVRITEAWLGN